MKRLFAAATFIALFSGSIDAQVSSVGTVLTAEQVEQVLSTAHDIWQKERQQAELIQAGKKLRAQLQFDQYLVQRRSDETYTFRQHLRSIGGAIEE